MARRGGRRGEGMDVWALAHDLHKKDKLRSLSDECKGGEEEAKKYITRLCMLAISEDPLTSGFAKRCVS